MRLTHANVRQLPAGTYICFETEGGSSCFVELVNTDTLQKADLVGKIAIKGPATAGRPNWYSLQSK